MASCTVSKRDTCFQMQISTECVTCTNEYLNDVTSLSQQSPHAVPRPYSAMRSCIIFYTLSAVIGGTYFRLTISHDWKISDYTRNKTTCAESTACCSSDVFCTHLFIA